VTRYRKETEYVEVQVHCHAETTKAALLSPDGQVTSAVWIPKSQIRGSVTRDKDATIEIAEWIAEREGLI
jgi:hypothetical protein